MALKSVSQPGPAGPAGPSNIGGPASRTITQSTAFQALDPTHPSVININLTSTASVTLSGGFTNSANVVIGSTSGVATGIGTTVGSYVNSITGTVVIGIALSTQATTPICFLLPTAWYFAIVPVAGSVTVTSCFDQTLGAAS